MKPPTTCPPSNPISTRTRSSSATRHHLRENAVNRIRVHESDLEAEEPLARCSVDQLGALLGELGQRRRNVVHLVREMMQSGSALRDELPYGRVVSERREQLDPAVTDPNRRGLD